MTSRVHPLLKSSLFSTGKYREGDERSIEPAPWTVCDSFAQAVELIVASLIER